MYFNVLNPIRVSYTILENTCSTLYRFLDAIFITTRSSFFDGRRFLNEYSLKNWHLDINYLHLSTSIISYVTTRPTHIPKECVTIYRIVCITMKQQLSPGGHDLIYDLNSSEWISRDIGIEDVYDQNIGKQGTNR